VLDILKFHAQVYSSIASSLGTIQAACKSAEWKSATGTISQENRKTMPAAFSNIKKQCQQIGLTLSAKAAERGLALLKSDTVKFKELGDIAADISRRINDELEGNLFLHIPFEKAKLYEPTKPLFGETVAKAFPSASDDVAEAGKCLATDRGTATVFHVMRVMEAGLKSLAKQLGIPYAPSWESYLRQISTRLELDWKDKSPEWKTDEGFYREAAAHLSAVKFAFRNPTMHIVKQYSPESAEEIFNSVGVFMRHLSTKISEEKQGR
jgi:hypothetical protein